MCKYVFVYSGLSVSVCICMLVQERLILTSNKTLDANTVMSCLRFFTVSTCSLGDACQHKVNASNCSLWESKHRPAMRENVFSSYHTKSNLFLFCLVSGHNWQR